ncbi:hypothetical protein ACHAXH_008392 [Discostella pseudostelligera]
MVSLQPLREYLRNNIAHLRSSPCLLISSAPPPQLSPSSTSTTPSSSASSAASSLDLEQRRQFKHQTQTIHSFVQRNTQSITLEYNLKTIPCHISSAFPTLASVDEAVSLARRAGLKGSGGGGGEGVIIGLGTGAAIDLAKAVADSLFENGVSSSSTSFHDGYGNHGGGTLLLAPCTLGGLWAASSNLPSILLDTKEEVLLPHRTSCWRNMTSKETSAIRNGTIVTMDPMRYWAMPPLYAPFRPAKRSDYSSPLLPPMAHVAAAALAILLDVARSIDVDGLGVGTSNVDVDSTKQQQQEQTMMLDMKEVASSCASVLVLAAHEAKTERNEERIVLAQQHLVDAISRLTSISSPHTTTSSSGTIPQTLANALLPTYFPQCHYITYLASTLTGLCDMLSENSPSSSSSLNGKDESMVGMLTSSILESSNTIDSTMQISSSSSSSSSKASASLSLSSWATHASANAGLPSMASLAYGTPDVNALVNSLDSYTALMGSEGGHAVGCSNLEDDYWVMEDVLRRGLHR